VEIIKTDQSRMTDCQELPGIPPEVPQHYRDQLIQFQNQIKTLILNHQVLLSRLEKNPQDTKVVGQIEQVKIYLISFSEQQEEVLEKVRFFLKKNVKEVKEKSPDSKASTPKSKTKGKGKGKKVSSEVTSDDSGDERDSIYLSYLVREDCYRGHVEVYDVECPGPEAVERIEEETIEDLVQRNYTETLDEIEKDNFMFSIDLLTEPIFEQRTSRLEKLRKRKKCRSITQIPEISDKKYRYQTFLQSTITSPPHLRRRKPNQLPSLPPRQGLRTISLPPPEKMETRKKTVNMMKTQVDGCQDLTDEMESEESSPGESEVYQRLEYRNFLLKRKLEMEEEMETLQKRAKVLQDKREDQKDEKLRLLKEQKETEVKIRTLLQNLVDSSTSNLSM